MWAIQLYFTRRYLKEVPIIGSMTKNYSSISYHVWHFARFKNSYTFFANPKCSSFAVLGGIIYLFAILSLKVVDVKELKQIIGKK